MHILDALLAFCAYFFIGAAMVIVFLFIYSKITPHNEWQLIKITILRHRWPLAVRCWLCHPLIQRGDKLGQYPGLFCLGRHCAGDSTADLWLRKVYMPTLSEKLFITTWRRGYLWEPQRWLAVFLTLPV